jgi:hypothetical protein
MSPWPIAAVALLSAAFLVLPLHKGHSEMNPDTQSTAAATADHPYVGLWVTADRRVRHRLLPNGRYDEARGTRESAYRGRYEVTGNEIFYWDDTGFTADGVFIDGVLHHGGMILYRTE